MPRTSKCEELDQVTEGLGMANLEQYNTKADLVKAIGEHQQKN